MKWLGVEFIPCTVSFFSSLLDPDENERSEMSHLQLWRFCHSSAYSFLMMQNDTKYPALGGTYTDFITRYF